MKKFRSTLLGIALAGLATIASLPAYAEGIKAVVNGEPVTANEVQQRARFLHLIQRDIPNATLESNALEELIDEKLRFQEAKRRKLTISDQQVEGALGNIAARVHLSSAQLVAGLQQSGIDPATLRNRLRGQIIFQQMVMGRFDASSAVSDQDVVKALQEKEGKDGKTSQSTGMSNEYAVQQIIFVVPAAAGKGGAESRMREAEKLRSSFSGCENIQAETHAFKETVVKNLGRRTDEELPQAFVAVLGQTPVGKLTKPQITPNGVEMLAVCDKREVKGDLLERAKVVDSLREQKGQLVARQLNQDLRKYAVIQYK
jgi:peptidyl-prolyl cis-trans isomerase SurA